MQLQNQDVHIPLASASLVIDQITQLITPNAPFEVFQKQRNGCHYTAFASLPKNLGHMYSNAADTHGDSDFLVYQHERYSFRQLHELATAFSEVLLHQYSLKKGDKVVIAMRNYPEWIIAFMGITRIGLVAVPVNVWLSEQELLHVIEHSQATCIVIDDKRFDLLSDSLCTLDIPVLIARPNAAQQVKLESDNNTNLCFRTLLDAYQTKDHISCDEPLLFAKLDVDQVVGDDIATIFYTSGSTGKPKGAVSSHEGVLSALNTWCMLGLAATNANEQLIDVETKTPDLAPCALMTVPLFHVTGCHTLFLLSMLIGRKTVMMPYWDPGIALSLIEQERVTYFNGVPTMSIELMNHPDKDKYDLDSLLDVCAGGAARAPEHVRKIYDSFSAGSPSCGYGLTETNALGAVNGPVDYLAKPHSAGLPTPPIVDIKIIDEQGKDLARGEIGEIIIKSISNILEYWRDLEATNAAFINGYFKTGDMGYLDDDGFLYIVDRKKDIIIRGGENISSLEVENALYEYPHTIEASVFSIPDKRLGELVGAVVHVTDADSIDTNDIKSFVGQIIAHFKVPAQIWLIEQQLPRLGSGKIDKRALQTEYLKKHTSK